MFKCALTLALAAFIALHTVPVSGVSAQPANVTAHVDAGETALFASGLKEKLALNRSQQRRRKVIRTLKGKKKKKKHRYPDEPAKTLKLAVTQSPTTAPLHLPTNTLYPSASASLSWKSTGSPTGNPSGAIGRDGESASKRHHNGGSSGKGGSGKGKKKKKGKSKKSKKSSTDRENYSSPSHSIVVGPTMAPSLIHADSLQYPTTAPNIQTPPPFPDLLDMPSLFRPPSDLPTLTSIPTVGIATSSRPVGFVPIPPARGNPRPTPPLIVLAPVTVSVPTSRSPTTLLQTFAPSKGSVILASPSISPRSISPSPTDGSSTFNPTDVNTMTPTAMISEVSNGSELSNTTASTSSNITALPSSADSSLMQPAPTPTPSATTLPILTSLPTSDNGIRRISVPRIYIAYVAPDTERSPTAPETLFVVQLTTLYYEEIFSGLYRDSEFSFESVELELVSDLYDKAIPEERFNLYLEFDADFLFRVVDNTVELPQASDIFGQMMGAIDTIYIMDYIWQVPRESPYFRTEEAAGGAVANSRQTAGDTKPRAKEQSLGLSLSQENATLSESVQQLEDRFILPGSKLPAGLFRLNDVLEEEEGN